MGELTKTADATRINEASVSQPICTAVQVMIVDILKAARVSFTSVVGHSSGEIAAAYATGYISAEDAIRIAYYRGYFLDASMTDSVTDGAMLAAGTSFSDAYELCALPSLRGRICIAAKNSPTSMTLSGDRAAVNDAKEILEDEGKFARILKVDRAYHSHHMVSCLQPYVEALRDLRIKVQTPTQGSAVWVSSVTGERMDASHSTNLATSYWAENMAGTVLFSDALSYAVGAYGIPSMVVEVGPHPALRAPVLETVHHVVGQSVPYIGTLSRGLDDSISISRCLGSLWATLGSSVVDFSAFDKAVHGVKNAPSNLLKNLPTYPWDHHNTFCHQTRQSKAFLYNDRRPHQLLGKLGPDGTKRHIRYRNFLSAREIPWLAHHQVQGQIVFPAAGYVSVVVEAVALQYDLDNVKLVEVTNFLISHALVFPHDSEVETILSVTIQDSGPDFDVFSFVFHSGAQPDESHRLAQNASGCIRVAYGVPHDSVLPTPRPIRGQWTDLEPGIFYSSCDELGFEYMGDFRGLVDISRRTDEATGCLAVPTHVDPKNTPLIIHPATLDSGIQSLVVGYCHPRDGRLRSIHLPTRVAKISINLQRCRDDTCIGGTRLPFHSIVTSDQPVDFMGDVYIYSSDGTATIIQIEGLQITPLTPPLPDDDVRMFTEPHWGFDTPADSDLQEYQRNHSDEYSMSLDMELLAYHYLKVLNSSVPQSRRDDLAWHHQRFLEYAQHCLSWVEAGTHPWISVGSGDELEKQVELICKQ
jgi:hybrid polyketide synthase / nonribosomal peptide synthetase ACE1